MKKNVMYLIFFLIVLGGNHKILAQTPIVTITTKVNDDKTVELSYIKDKPGTYTVNLEFTNVENSDTRDYTTQVKGYSGSLCRLRPLDKTRAIRYSMRYYTIMGEVNPRVDSLFRYTLPFKNGKKVKIYEAGNIGEKYFGQEKISNWKSYVVHLEKPDTICSMRKGIVVTIKDEYADNSSMDAHYTSMRNSIVVEHADGTYASYKGFKKNAIFVKLGETVYPQTQLGIVEKYDSKGYRLDFSVYYLSDKYLKANRNQSLKGYKRNYQYIMPFFVTEEGETTIESKKEYTTVLNDTVITQEFSRSEKKKYAKEHPVAK